MDLNVHAMSVSRLIELKFESGNDRTLMQVALCGSLKNISLPCLQVLS